MLPNNSTQNFQIYQASKPTKTFRIEPYTEKVYENFPLGRREQSNSPKRAPGPVRARSHSKGRDGNISNIQSSNRQEVNSNNSNIRHLDRHDRDRRRDGKSQDRSQHYTVANSYERSQNYSFQPQSENVQAAKNINIKSISTSYSSYNSSHSHSHSQSHSNSESREKYKESRGPRDRDKIKAEKIRSKSKNREDMRSRPYPVNTDYSNRVNNRRSISAHSRDRAQHKVYDRDETVASRDTGLGASSGTTGSGHSHLLTDFELNYVNPLELATDTLSPENLRKKGAEIINRTRNNYFRDPKHSNSQIIPRLPQKTIHNNHKHLVSSEISSKSTTTKNSNTNKSNYSSVNVITQPITMSNGHDRPQQSNFHGNNSGSSSGRISPHNKNNPIQRKDIIPEHVVEKDELYRKEFNDSPVKLYSKENQRINVGAKSGSYYC